mgnify:CR=1 FL=1
MKINIRRLAQGQDCTARIPGICNHNPETTVLAHDRYGFFGYGVKPHDLTGCFVCSSCHDLLDGRTKADGLPDTIHEYWRGAHCRTLQIIGELLDEKDS